MWFANLTTFTQICNGLIGWWQGIPAYSYLRAVVANLEK